MVEKIDPIKYADAMRRAWQEDDEEAARKIKEKYGKQEVKLEDLEELFSYTISLLMTAYMGKDVVDDAKFNILVNTLRSKGIIDDNEEHNIRGEIEHIESKIEGED